MASRNPEREFDQKCARDVSRCPTPNKVAFGSRRLARNARKRFDKAKGDNLSAYLCPCGAWHLGRLPAQVRRGQATRRTQEQR